VNIILLLPSVPILNNRPSNLRDHLYLLRCSSRYASLFETPISFATFFNAAFSSRFCSAMIWGFCEPSQIR
jgi:hypothetical protein